MWKTGYCIDTKQAQEKSPTNQQPMKRLDSISFASVVMIAATSVTPPSAEAQWQGSNERKWAASIQSDIRNGAPASDICTNASSSANTSDEVPFKNWAYSIARKYCKEGFETVEASSSTPTSTPTTGSLCTLDSSDIFKISVGAQIQKYDKDCWSSFN